MGAVGRAGVRSPNPAIINFTGLDWFPIDPAYRLRARFLPFSRPPLIPIVNVLGDFVQMPCPGIVEFGLDGQQFQLEPVEIEEGRLWFLFRDATNGNETYPAGRYLKAGAPEEDKVEIDFNRATIRPGVYPVCNLSAPAAEQPTAGRDLCRGAQILRKRNPPCSGERQG